MDYTKSYQVIATYMIETLLAEQQYRWQNENTPCTVLLLLVNKHLQEGRQVRKTNRLLLVRGIPPSYSIYYESQAPRLPQQPAIVSIWEKTKWGRSIGRRHFFHIFDDDNRIYVPIVCHCFDSGILTLETVIGRYRWDIWIGK